MDRNFKILGNLGIEVDYIILGSIIAIAILLLMVIILFVKQSKLNKRYRQFMNGEDGISLEEVIRKRIDEISVLEEKSVKHDNYISDIKDILKLTFQKYGIVKYDAFEEMGGKLSFALALLNQNNDGFIINSMHSNREGCFTYLKIITNGESSVVMSDSEKKALDSALNFVIK